MNNRTQVTSITKFGPIKKCIYCDAADYSPASPGSKLHDEHIIPAALGATLLLTEASCQACEAITSRFEGQLFRHVFWSLRVGQSIRNSARRKNEPRPQSMPMKVQKGNEAKTIEVSNEFHPQSAALPIFTWPSFLTKLPSANIDSVVHEILWLEGSEKNPTFKNGEKAIIEAPTNPRAFARLIAKIAYCAAVAQYGLDPIDSFVKQIILDKKAEALQFVGMIPASSMRCRELGYNCSIHLLKQHDKTLIIGRVQLFGHFGNPGAPNYLCVVGALKYFPAPASGAGFTGEYHVNDNPCAMAIEMGQYRG